MFSILPFELGGSAQKFGGVGLGIILLLVMNSCKLASDFQGSNSQEIPVANNLPKKVEGFQSPKNNGQNFDKTDSILGGERVKRNHTFARSTVSIYARINGNKIAFLCTGVLIEKRVVMTAAHCFTELEEAFGKTMKQLSPYVVIGFGNLQAQSLKSKFPYLKGAKKVVYPKDFDPRNLTISPNAGLPDIALVQLLEDAPADYNPVALLRDSSALKPGTSLFLAGFGKTNGKDRVYSRMLRTVEVKVDNPHKNPFQISFDISNGKGSCKGDSGAPAYYYDDQGVIFVGAINSWGDEDCVEISTYTSVPKMMKWIDQELPLLIKMSSFETAEVVTEERD